MKKLLLFVALSLSVATTFAQKGLHVGALFNPNSTWLLNQDDSDFADFRYKSTFGFAAGAHINYHFTDGVGLGIELLGMSQGQNGDTRAGIDFKKRLTYFKIPLLVVFNTNSESVVGFQGKFGPAIGILTGAKFLDGDGDDFIGVDQEEFKDAHKKLLVSAVLGFGLAFNISEHFRLDAGLRFDVGLTDPEDNKDLLRLGYSRDYNESRTWALNGGFEVAFYYILPIR